VAHENLNEVVSRVLSISEDIGKGTFKKKDIKGKSFGDWVNFDSGGKRRKGVVVSKKGSSFVIQTFGKSGVERVYHVELTK